MPQVSFESDTDGENIPPSNERRGMKRSRRLPACSDSDHTEDESPAPKRAFVDAFQRLFGRSPGDTEQNEEDVTSDADPSDEDADPSAADLGPASESRAEGNEEQVDLSATVDSSAASSNESGVQSGGNSGSDELETLGLSIGLSPEITSDLKKALQKAIEIDDFISLFQWKHRLVNFDR